jgi:hypothetical protein
MRKFIPHPDPSLKIISDPASLPARARSQDQIIKLGQVKKTHQDIILKVPKCEICDSSNFNDFLQCGGSGMFIPDPDFYPSRIPDPGSWIPDPKTATKDRSEKIFCQTIFRSLKFHKTEYYFIFDMLKKKNWPNFPRIIEVPKKTQKIVTKPSKIWVWDPESEIRDPEKTYS